MTMVEELTRANAREKINRLVAYKNDLDKKWDAVTGLLGGDNMNTGTLGDSVWSLFDFTVRAVGKLVNDEHEHLQWFIWENACGRNGLKCSDQHNRMVKVKTVEDLLDVLGYAPSQKADKPREVSKRALKKK